MSNYNPKPLIWLLLMIGLVVLITIVLLPLFQSANPV